MLGGMGYYCLDYQPALVAAAVVAAFLGNRCQGWRYCPFCCFVCVFVRFLFACPACLSPPGN